MADSNSLNRIPVLIAGAGPVGLSLAIELAYRGICSLLVANKASGCRSKSLHLTIREYEPICARPA